MVQFHILRRMGAPLAALMGAYLNKKADPGQLMVPVMEAMGQLSDPDAEYIVNSALSVVHRHQPGTEAWSPVLSPGGGIMFADIHMLNMMSLAFKVIEVQLDDFFPDVGPRASTVGPAGNGRASPGART